MIRVLFCCHGNICRSPLAQSVFSYKIHQLGFDDQFYIDSMATSTEEIGNPPHYGTVKKLREVGIPLVPHRAKQIMWSDYNRAEFERVWLFFNSHMFLNKKSTNYPQNMFEKVI